MLEYVEILADQMRETAGTIFDKEKAPLVAMFASDERSLYNKFAIYCIFGGKGNFECVKANIDATGVLEFPSLSGLIDAAVWYEREIHDLFGLIPVGHPDLRPLVLHENWPQGVFPLRKDFLYSDDVEQGDRKIPPQHIVHGEGVFEVPVGPIHAGIIEPGHFRFSQAGETIIHLDAKLFFTHRGIEKALEGLSLEKALYQIERICGACSVSNSLSFVQAVEKLSSLDVPVRAQYLRVIVAELERLYNHIGDIGNLCAGLGFAVGISQGARLKEYLMRLNERLTGNRFLRGMIISGGVRFDFTEKYIVDIADTLREVEREFEELLSLFRDNDAFLDRVHNTGILSNNAAVDLGVVGIAARASGVDTDFRRDYPYLIYPDVKFQVPVYTSGDVAARLWVRADEVFQSLRIIRKIIRVLPMLQAVELHVPIPSIPAYTSAMGWSESPRGSNLHWLMAGENNTIYRSFIRSASYPNWPALTVAAPDNIIPDFPLINKSFELCYACLDR